jgi:hypothetical protein
MGLVLPLNETTTVTGAKQYLLQLSRSIFEARDFADVDQDICTAVKIMVGLQALTLDSPQSITAASRQQIVVTLNNICNLYNNQMPANF